MNLGEDYENILLQKYFVTEVLQNIFHSTKSALQPVRTRCFR
jgi:hypothetical protein